MSIFIGSKIRRAMNIRSFSLVGLMILPLMLTASSAMVVSYFFEILFELLTIVIFFALIVNLTHERHISNIYLNLNGNKILCS